MAPSEVRNMTLGEIDAVIWAKIRHQKPDADSMAEMYQDLQEALGK